MRALVVRSAEHQTEHSLTPTPSPSPPPATWDVGLLCPCAPCQVGHNESQSQVGPAPRPLSISPPLAWPGAAKRVLGENPENPREIPTFPFVPTSGGREAGRQGGCPEWHEDIHGEG